jgi:hypothetical protein
MEETVPNSSNKISPTLVAATNKNLLQHEQSQHLEETLKSDDELLHVDQIVHRRDRKSLKMIKIDLHHIPSSSINLLSNLEVTRLLQPRA